MGGEKFATPGLSKTVLAVSNLEDIYDILATFSSPNTEMFLVSLLVLQGVTKMSPCFLESIQTWIHFQVMLCICYVQHLEWKCLKHIVSVS